jgi:hypothetical protein
MCDSSGVHDRLLAVDATLKKIIETLEPGVHQFWPIRMTMPKGKDYPVPYYGMIICRFIDSFVPEQSDVRQSEDVFFAKGPTKKVFGNLTVSNTVVAGAHLWRERRLLIPNVFFRRPAGGDRPARLTHAETPSAEDDLTIGPKAFTRRRFRPMRRTSRRASNFAALPRLARRGVCATACDGAHPRQGQQP